MHQLGVRSGIDTFPWNLGSVKHHKNFKTRSSVALAAPNSIPSAAAGIRVRPRTPRGDFASAHHTDESRGQDSTNSHGFQIPERMKREISNVRFDKITAEPVNHELFVLSPKLPTTLW
jgi:hypothetical protein